jgi:hypothetical protein
MTEQIKFADGIDEGQKLWLYRHLSQPIHRCGDGSRQRSWSGDPWPLWTRRFKRDGYVAVRAPGGWVREHIWIAEHYLVGRAIKADEVVHHENEIRGDNRPENLRVMTRREHRVHHNGDDKVKKASSNHHKKLWKDPDYRAKMTAINKNNQTPEALQKNSESNKKHWDQVRLLWQQIEEKFGEHPNFRNIKKLEKLLASDVYSVE